MRISVLNDVEKCGVGIIIIDYFFSERSHYYRYTVLIWIILLWLCINYLTFALKPEKVIKFVILSSSFE